MKHFFASLLAMAAVPAALAAGLPAEPPVAIDFSEWDEASFAGAFTTVNANNDTKEFVFDSSMGVAKLEYSRSLAGDDWVITKTPLKLTEGVEYTFKVLASSYASGATYAETFEFKAGTSANASAMTTSIIPVTTFSSDMLSQPKEFEGKFTPATTGDYYLGFHALTPANDGFYIGFGGLTVTGSSASGEVVQPVAPAPPILMADAGGATKVCIRAIAPDKDVLGNTLTMLRSITIYRDGRAITGGQEPCGWYDQQCVPGEMTGEFYDSALYGLTPGLHTYYLKASNFYGESTESEHATVFVGIPRPGAPSDATAVETSNRGEVTVTWKDATTDYDGNPINPDMLSYAVYDITDAANPVKLAEVKGVTTYTYQAVGANDFQIMKRYRVMSLTSAGQSRNGAETAFIPVGKPLQLPYTDSFADGGKSYAFNTLGGDGEYAIFKTHFPAFDGDKGVAAFTGGAEGDKAEMLSCQVEIPADASNVVMSYFYSGANEGNSNTLELLVDAGNGFEVTRTRSLSDGLWHRDEIDLSHHAGKCVRFGFRSAYGNSEAVLVDNIRIASRAAVDVAIDELIVPAMVQINAETPVQVNVSNTGTSRIDNVTVVLYLNDAVVATEKFPLDMYGSMAVNFRIKVPMTDAKTATLRATVKAEGDANSADNTSATVNTKLVMSRMPAVTDLKAGFKPADKAVELTWSEPSTDGITAETVTESFENYNSWSQTFGDWKTIDADGNVLTGSSVTDHDIFVGISGGAASFFVADDSEFHETLKARTGSKLLIAGASDGSMNGKWNNDDWLISPRLSGNEQTIDFYAQGGISGYPATVEIYQSFTGTEIADFGTMIHSYSVPATMWYQLKFIVDEGARYFAIRTVNANQAELKIDDITYEPAIAGADLDVTGYNVYCDNTLLNTEPVSATTFTHSEVSEGVHSYFVTALYSDGSESAPSNIETVNADYTGIDTADAASQVRIEAADGAVVVTAPAGTAVVVSAMDGRTVFSGAVKGTKLSVSLAPGIYAVSAATTVAKLIVR